ncbi:acyltransferase [Kluyvera sp. SCKS090646]|uniref:Acyltransferase n=1 Tax=Kluyvera sichuanensis TaxID=2725494 RepID=A0ABR6RQX8_9ENTR|nr:acyltransferase [Kluyvera sichuanensis]MBC1185538.1 acyltransferase [Kluyvera sichuanensis]
MIERNPAQNRFEVLDSFRGICAICVVFFHMTIINGLSTLPFFRGSNVFVEFFFVLSGFVLTHGFAYKQHLSFKKYITARFFRIYPLHVFTLAVMIILEFGKLVAEKHGVSFQIHSFTITKDVSEILPNLFLVQAWTHLTQNESFNGPAWSISIEFYTYILFFFTLMLSWRLRVASWVAISATAFLFIAYNYYYFTPNVVRGLSCFFLGSLTYVLIRRIHNRIDNDRLTCIFISLEIVIPVIIYSLITSDLQHKNIMLSFVFAICISIFSFQKGPISKLLTATPLVWAGKLSYSIYMTHAAVLLVITSIFIVTQKFTGIELTKIIDNSRVIDAGGPYMNTALSIATLAIVILTSIVTYNLIEKPFIQIGKDILMKQAKSSIQS